MSEEETLGTEHDSVEENIVDMPTHEPADAEMPTEEEIVVDHPIVSNARSNNRSCGCFPDESVVDTPYENPQILSGRFVEGQFETGPHPAGLGGYSELEPS